MASFIASYEEYDIKGLNLNNGRFTQKYITDNDNGAGSDVFTTGLLASHFGTQKNIPVVRTGNIASMPEEPVDLGPRLGHQEVYLVESRSIGGLSGSPVFLNTPPVRFVRGDAVLTGGHHTEYLIGVNIGLFHTKAHGDAIPTERMDFREEFLEMMSAGIAIVVPIERAIEIISESALFRKHRSELLRPRT